MGKSIEYIKQRLPDCKFDSMYEMDICGIIKEVNSDKIYELKTKAETSLMKCAMTMMLILTTTQ
jgi:hypothetical protein